MLLQELRVLACVLAVLLSSQSQAAPGQLDPTFGTDGKTTFTLGSGWNNSEANSVAVQSDGKIVVAGHLYMDDGSGTKIAVARFLADGTLDPSFGTHRLGVTLTDVSTAGPDFGFAVALQSDGRILVAGRADMDTVVVRYTSSGALDPSFGTNGVVVTSVSEIDGASSIAVQDDGKIVVLSSAVFSPFSYLIRYLPDGSLDPDFGADGIAAAAIGSDSIASEMALQADGKIVFSGHATMVGDWSVGDTFVARVGSDGNLDTTFGVAGIAASLMGQKSYNDALAIQGDGRIVAGGAYLNAGAEKAALVRIDADGNLDTSFDGDGRIFTDFTRVRELAVQPDGKILALSSSTTLPFRTELVRYHTSGAFDTSFGGGGAAVDTTGDWGKSFTLQPDGKIVVVGNAKDADFYVARHCDVQCAVSGYQFLFRAERFELTGSSNFTDEFESGDGYLSGWSSVGTASEADGFVTLSSPGEINSFGDVLPVVLYRSDILRSFPGVTDGVGDFEVTAAWDPILPSPPRDFYGLYWTYAPPFPGPGRGHALFINNFESALANAFSGDACADDSACQGLGACSSDSCAAGETCGFAACPGSASCTGIACSEGQRCGTSGICRLSGVCPAGTECVQGELCSDGTPCPVARECGDGSACELTFPAGLSVGFYTIEVDRFAPDHATSFTAAGVPLEPGQVTGQIVFRMSFDDATNQMTPSFSLDGGDTFLAPFPPEAIPAGFSASTMGLVADPPESAIELQLGKGRQACIVAMNKAAAKFARTNSKEAERCLKAAAGGDVAKLGTPPQPQTAQGCLTNDVSGKLAKAVAKLEAAETKKCQAAASQLPSFAYTGSGNLAVSARSAALNLTAGLFGDDLGAAVVSSGESAVGANCQAALFKAAHKLFDALWSVTLKAKTETLAGKTATAALNSAALQAGIEASLTGDAASPKGKVPKAQQGLANAASKACGATFFADLFPGACSTATTTDDVASCMTNIARCRFCRSLNDFDALAIDCDEFDDDSSNLSCD